jgi:predicted signal transduction protein with EAL and GGDEF domain
VVFTAEHAESVKRRANIEHCLRTADLENEMSLQFQPIVDIVNCAPDGFEALARWNSPELGHVSPGQFIPIAERSEMISCLTLVLFRKVLDAARQLPYDLRVAFNLSARNLASPLLILEIKAMLERSDVGPRRVEVEVTETAFTNDFGLARSSISLIKSLGARISLDDFGAGYSSLSHAHRLPLDKLKIDRSFICDIREQSALAPDRQHDNFTVAADENRLRCRRRRNARAGRRSSTSRMRQDARLFLRQAARLRGRARLCEDAWRRGADTHERRLRRRPLHKAGQIT